MQITEITVSYQETANLGNYSNVKPSISLKATLAEGDDEQVCISNLADQARAFVQHQVDEALEADDQAPKYSSEPRFDLLQHYRGKLVIIAPHRSNLGGVSTAVMKRRLPVIQRHAWEYVNDSDNGYQLIDCSDGNLEPARTAIAAADAAEEERQRQRQAEQEAQRQRWAAQQQVRSDEDDEDDGEEDDDEEDPGF